LASVIRIRYHRIYEKAVVYSSEFKPAGRRTPATHELTYKPEYEVTFFSSDTRHTGEYGSPYKRNLICKSQ